MSGWDPHHRREGYLAAWQELNRRVAHDIERGTGDIKPPRILFSKEAQCDIDYVASDVLPFFRRHRSAEKS